MGGTSNCKYGWCVANICGYWLPYVVGEFGICWYAIEVVAPFVGVDIGIGQPTSHCQPWGNCEPNALCVGGMGFPSNTNGTNGVLKFGRTCYVEIKIHKSLQPTIYTSVSSHKANNVHYI